MIIDSFIFFNELDILKIRLEELYPVVDRFVLIESNRTFRGNPKPYFYKENEDLFMEYRDKIHNVSVVDPNNFGDDSTTAPWKREEWQRNQIVTGIYNAEPDDIIIVSDVDEIPSREVVKDLNPEVDCTIGMNMYYYGLNVHAGVWEEGAKAIRYKYFTSAEQIRHSHPEASVFGGWHFSYLGDEKHISDKLRAFSHWELDIPEINNEESLKQRMGRLVDLWGHGTQYTRVEIDNTYPVEVLQNIEYYSKYIK